MTRITLIIIIIIIIIIIPYLVVYKSNSSISRPPIFKAKNPDFSSFLVRSKIQTDRNFPKVNLLFLEMY